MQTSNLIISLLVMSAVAFLLGYQRSLGFARDLGGVRNLHSLPSYYGMRVALWCGLPSALLLFSCLAFEETIISNMLLAGIPDEIRPNSVAEYNLLMNKIENLASGALSVEDVKPALIDASAALVYLRDMSQRLVTGLALLVAGGGGLWSWWRMSAQLRARQQVEKVLKGFLLFCASLAIFTTLGILLSLIHISEPTRPY